MTTLPPSREGPWILAYGTHRGNTVGAPSGPGSVVVAQQAGDTRQCARFGDIRRG